MRTQNQAVLTVWPSLLKARLRPSIDVVFYPEHHHHAKDKQKVHEREKPAATQVGILALD